MSRVKTSLQSGTVKLKPGSSFLTVGVCRSENIDGDPEEGGEEAGEPVETPCRGHGSPSGSVPRLRVTPVLEY